MGIDQFAQDADRNAACKAGGPGRMLLLYGHLKRVIGGVRTRLTKRQLLRRLAGPIVDLGWYAAGTERAARLTQAEELSRS
jgi:hypothetical protein